LEVTQRDGRDIVLQLGLLGIAFHAALNDQVPVAIE
jgi:hypothetical protein